MNLAGNYLLKKMYHKFENNITPSEFGKLAFKSMKNIEEFNIIWNEATDLFNPSTAPKNTKRLQGKLRNIIIEQFIDNYHHMIYNQIFTETDEKCMT